MSAVGFAVKVPIEGSAAHGLIPNTRLPRCGMRLPALRLFALSLPHTTWVKQWGECLVFKVAGKMFLIIALDAETIDGVVFKCTPDEFDELTEIDGITQAPYCAKRHWVRVGDLAALPAAELERRIRRSYGLVVAKLPKKIQATLK